jgi:hypothetical protein
MRFRSGNLLARISGCFEGEAGEWFSCWSPLDRRSWASLRRNLGKNFASSANFGKLTHDAISYNSGKCRTYGFYGRIKLQKLNALRAPFIQQQLLSLICFDIKDNVLQAQMMEFVCSCPISAFVAPPVQTQF